MRIDRRRFNQEEEIATTASAPDRHWPECGQHIWGKFNKRTRRTCSVTYLLDDDIDPSNTSDVRWGAAFPHPSPAPPKAMADPDSAVASVLHRTGVTPRPIVVGDGRARPTTFDALYPLEIRERVIAAEADTTPTPGWGRVVSTTAQRGCARSSCRDSTTSPRRAHTRAEMTAS